MNCLSDVLYILVTLLFYRLFRRANAVIALVATVFSLMGCAVDLRDQLHPGSVRLNPLLFFGPFCVLLRFLVLRSRFLPRWLGWPVIAAGMGWLAVLIPVVAQHAKVVIFLLGFPGGVRADAAATGEGRGRGALARDDALNCVSSTPRATLDIRVQLGKRSNLVSARIHGWVSSHVAFPVDDSPQM